MYIIYYKELICTIDCMNWLGKTKIHRVGFQEGKRYGPGQVEIHGHSLKLLCTGDKISFLSPFTLPSFSFFLSLFRLVFKTSN